jgi:hypothetical protein
MRRPTRTILVPAALVAALLAGCTATDEAPETSSSPSAPVDQSADVTVEQARAANTGPDAVDLQASSDEVAVDLTAPAAGDGVTVDGGTVTITAAGTYRVTGTVADGSLVVDATDDGVVHLILDDATLTSSTTSPLRVLDADQVVVHLEGANQLADTAAYAEDDEASAALFSTADLTITGDGALTVAGNANDGIAAKDGLVVESGAITVDAVDDGIRGKDYLVVSGGTLDVTAGGDGLKSDNDEDETLGYVDVSGGSVEVTAGDDGIAAQTDVIVSDGTLTVCAGGGHGATVADDVSPKGVSGTVSVVVGGGTLGIDAADDGIGSDGMVSITDGALTIAAGDDGVHGDRALQISDGTVDITASVEGLEAGLITLAGGAVSVVASDDGVNASDPDSTGEPAPGGQASTDVGITITGGTLVIDADGDGLDANGFLTMTGGTAVVNGPTNAGNGALDVDGTFEVSGGTLLAAGSSSMAMTPADMSAQSFVAFTFPSTQPAGTVVQVLDADGDALAAFESSKDFSSLVYSSPDVVADQTYSAATGGSVSGQTLGGLAQAGDSTGSTVVTTGTAGEALAGMGGPGGGPGGGPAGGPAGGPGGGRPGDGGAPPAGGGPGTRP